MKKILLIENQVTQFRVLKESLQHEFKILPEVKDYELILDAVRIKLHEHYPAIVTNSADDILKHLVESNKFDLFIVDYKLAGSRYGKDGIWLASYLRDLDLRNLTIPVLFLSGRLKSEEGITKLIKPFLQPHDWVEKGYAAIRILDSNYVVDNVKPVIEKLLGRSDDERLVSSIENLNNDPYLGLAKVNLIKIRSDYFNKGFLDEKAKKYLQGIEKMVETGDYDDDNIKKLNDEFLNHLISK